jgi:hypothetical protein
MSHPNLSADGTITFDAFIGRNYTFGFAGDFGGGSLAVNFVLDGVAAPFPNSPLNGPGTFTAVAPGSQIQLVLSGSTDPDIEFSIAPVNSETPAAIGAITPAAVDAKIADAEPITAALENPSGLLPFIAAAQNFDTDSTVHSEPFTLSVISFGDSMPSATASDLVEEMARQWGLGAWTVAALGSPSENSTPGDFAFTGGASRPASFAQTPGQNWVNMPSGSTATHTLPRTTEVVTKSTTTLTNRKINTATAYRPLPGGCRKVAVLIATAPGAGTLDITVSQDQYSNLTASVNTDAAAGFVAQEFTPVDRHAPITVAIANSVATSTVMGVMYFSGEGGIIHWDASKGSSAMEDQLACLDGGNFKPAFQGLFRYLNTRMVLHMQRTLIDADAMENYGIFCTAFDAIPTSGGVTHLMIGELPKEEADEQEDIEARNAEIRAFAKTRGYAFLDGNKILGPYAGLETVGWEDDGTHYYNAPRRLITSGIMRQCNNFLTSQSLHAPGISLPTRINERMRMEMLEEAITDRIHLRNGYVINAASAGSGADYAATMDNTRGLVVTGGAAIGHYRAEIGSLGWGGGSSNFVLNHNQHDLTVTINAAHAANLVQHQRGWFAIGLRAGNTHTSVATCTAGRCFGVEIAPSDDVGNPDGVTGAGRLAARLWLYDGTSIIYSRWFRFSGSGAESSQNGGATYMWRWDLRTQTMTLWCVTPSSTPAARAIRPMASITSSGFASASTHGAFVFAGIQAATAPATTGFISVKNIAYRLGNVGYPHRRPT